MRLDSYQVQNAVMKNMTKNIVVVAIEPPHQLLIHLQWQLQSQVIVNVEDILKKQLEGFGMGKKMENIVILGLPLFIPKMYKLSQYFLYSLILMFIHFSGTDGDTHIVKSSVEEPSYLKDWF